MSVFGIKSEPLFSLLAHEIGHNMGCLHNREDASDIVKVQNMTMETLLMASDGI